MRKQLYTIIVLLQCVIIQKNTQAQTYPFSNYTMETGLSHGQILSVFQDDDGVMWFGTSGGGITKYDGNSYEYITDKDGLADNVVYSIVKDKNGKILIGTNNGLSVYDTKSKVKINGTRFKNYTTKNGLSHNRIFMVLFEDDGSALLGTGKGLSRFKDTTCSLVNLSEELNNASVFYLVKDSKKQLWLGTLGNGVFRYDGKSIQNISTKNGLGNDMVFSVLEYKPENYWIFTGEGLFELNNGNVAPLRSQYVDSTASFYSYFKDKNNTLMIASSVGVLKYDKHGNQSFFNNKNGLVDNSIWKIFQDKESNVWFASDHNGISKLANERFYLTTTKNGLINDEIKNLFQGKNGSLWIGTTVGISVYEHGVFTNYNVKDFGGNANIWDIEEDEKSNYLVGTGNGVLVYDGKTFKRITCRNKESQMNVVFDVYIDNVGEVWLATQLGIAKIMDGFIQPYDKLIKENGIVNKIGQDAKGIFWFCTNDGLFNFDGKTVKHFSEKDGLTPKRVKNFVNDKNGNLWFASNDGVFKYDAKRFTNITKDEILISKEVTSLIIDNRNIIWAGLAKGIIKIEDNGPNYKIRHYGLEDGFLGQECSQNSILIDNKGKLLIGTTNGLMVYQSEFDKENTFEPNTRIKKIDLFFQKTDWKLYADSVDNNNIPKDLELPYDKNYLTFNFIGVSLTTPSKVIYQYMLLGIDKDWRNSTKIEVTYSNIPPGDYKFLLKANNGEGVWNKVPVSFEFTILPPFWRTWWFYSIVGFIIISGIYSYVKIRSSKNKILKQNEIIAEKNSELQYANKEIAEKNQNITDSINYAKRIQQSFLTPDKIISQALKEHFILFKPRDIVSGDFYLAFGLPDRTIFVCSDCTGHGIPGAFMSLIGISILNEISRSKIILGPAEILEKLRSNIINALNPDKVESGGKDGMDIAVISIFKNLESNEVKIHFSGANSSMYLVSRQQKASVMNDFKGDKQPVAFYSNMKPFTQKEVIAKKGDMIYLYTDGYADQFGGVKGKKFMTKQLKHTLASICNMPVNDQLAHLDKVFVDWQGNHEQVDDVTVIGIKL
jgi:ligand-binding sensor domain-containing protein/serine phosphatase RsbU (regulator of sigma subunit)